MTAWVFGACAACVVVYTYRLACEIWRAGKGIPMNESKGESCVAMAPLFDAESAESDELAAAVVVGMRRPVVDNVPSCAGPGCASDEADAEEDGR